MDILKIFQWTATFLFAQMHIKIGRSNLHSILITGSKGLIGSHLKQRLQSLNYEVVELDNAYEARDSAYGCILNKDQLSQKVSTCSGVVHLAAVSRVIWGEQNPELCEETNHTGTRNVLEAAMGGSQKPWVIYASSREVYGEQTDLPVSENCTLKPMNVYAHTKGNAEKLISTAQENGLIGSILRFSNVFGSIEDHIDRVIPAFCHGALKNKDLRIEGSKNVFDFTFIDDVVRGIVSVIQSLESEKASLPPMHFTTGHGTTLGEAAELIVKKANSSSQLVEKPPRNFDVSRFYGSPARAKELLGWEPEYSFEQAIDVFLNRLAPHVAADRLTA